MARNRSGATAPAVKGNIVVGTGTDTSAVLAVGANGTTLVADSSEATGLKWQAPAGASFVGVGCTGTGNETINNNSSTIITWNTESFDTDSFHSTSSNTSRITIPSGKGGKYLFISHLALNNAGGTGRRSSHFYKNGVQTNESHAEIGVSTNAYPAIVNTFIYDLVATDYVETSFYQDSGGTFSISRDASSFQAVYLGA